MLAELRSDARWLLGIFIGLSMLYGFTLCRTVFWYDSAELAAAAAVLGIPHPPGYPLYTLLGHLYVALVPGEPALGVNVMSAAHGALAACLVFALQRKLGAERLAALAGTAFFATGASFWLNSVVAEVYTTGLAFALLTLLLLLHAYESGSTRGLWLAAFLGGLGFAAHMFVATLGLGYALLVLASAARPRARVALGAVLATLAGASLYLWVPLRASMNPPLDYQHPDTLERFLWFMSGGEYKYWFLRDYDFVARLRDVLGMMARHLTWPGLLLGACGLATSIATRRTLGLALLLAIAGNLWFFFAYAVDDVEVFFLPSAALLAICIGPLLRAAQARFPARRWLGGAQLALLVYVGVHAAYVYPRVDLSRRHDARDFGLALVSSLPKDAILLSFATPPEWKLKTVFEYYFQKTLGYRPDVITLDSPSREAMQKAFATGRPIFMYAHLTQLDPALDFENAGPLLRVRPKPGFAP